MVERVGKLLQSEGRRPVEIGRLSRLGRRDAILRVVARQKNRSLDLGRLAAGMPPGVTPAMGRFAAEAASVLFEHNGHITGVGMEVSERRTSSYAVTWPTLHTDAQRAHADLPAAAEQGAYGIAFLLAEQFTEFKIIERSRKKTGFDYYLGSGDVYPFQHAARMEVSGIVNDPARLPSRVNRKLIQTDRSAGALPAYVVVVEFSQPKSVFKKR